VREGSFYQVQQLTGNTADSGHVQRLAMDTAHSDQLLEEPMPSTRNRSSFLQLTLGVALLCALAGALALCVGPATRAPTPTDLDGLDDLIRAYNAERGRAPLTDVEVKSIRNFIEKKLGGLHSGWVWRIGLRFMGVGNGLIMRRLQEESLSEGCVASIKEGVQKIIRQLAKPAVDYAIDCGWGGEHSDDCKKTVEKLNNFDETVKEKCKASGDLCTVTRTHPKKGGGTETETEAFCMPKECRDEIEQAEQMATQKIFEGNTKDAVVQSGQSAEFGKGLEVDIKC